MALLFLKRSNLTREQTEKIAFRSDNLLIALAKRMPSEPTKPAKTGSLDGSAKKPPADDAARKSFKVSPPQGKADDSSSLLSAMRPATASADPIDEPSGSGRLWFLAILLLLIMCGVGLVFLAREKEEDERGKSRRVKKAHG